MSHFGNVLSGTGTYIKADGTTGLITDLWAKQDSFYTEHGDPYAVKEEIKILPNMMGSGQVPSLWQAAVQRQSLAELLEAFKPKTCEYT